MKKINVNNLLVNGKKLVFMVVLAASVGACGRTDKSVESENTKQDSVVKNTSDEQRQKDKKTLLWFAPVILVAAAGAAFFTSDAKTKSR